jgi:5-methylcytosine-specific restriction endonuclease McrA
MPIKKENLTRYPKNWKDIRNRILQRADNKCEFCGVENYALVQREAKVVKIILTIAHLDHTPENCNPNNLRALCQQCHLRYDARHHAETRRSNQKQGVLI